MGRNLPECGAPLPVNVRCTTITECAIPHPFAALLLRTPEGSVWVATAAGWRIWPSYLTLEEKLLALSIGCGNVTND